jgi:hypothetical protein
MFIYNSGQSLFLNGRAMAQAVIRLPRFDPTAFHVRFMLGKYILGLVFLRVLPFKLFCKRIFAADNSDQFINLE